MLTRNETQKLQRIISEEIINYLNTIDHNYGLVTVVDINLSKDISYLDIYLSASNFSENLFKDLKRISNSIKSKVSRNFSRYKSPIIRFKESKSVGVEIEILDLINNISKEIK